MSSTSSVRRVAAVAAGVLLAVGLGACSSDGDKAASSTTAVLSFEPVPSEATRLGVCTSITIDQMTGLLGDDVVASLPSSITEGGGAVTGESCSWDAKGEGSGASRSVHVEARDFADDTDWLAQRYEDLRAGTTGATDLPGVGDAAFSAETDDTTVVQIRTGHYLLTASSRGAGGEAPVTAGELGMVLAATMSKLP